MLHLSDINIYNDGSVSVKNIPTEPPVDVPVNPADRWAVANVPSMPNWWLDPAYSTWQVMVLSNKQCDNGYTNSRGRNFPVSNALWDFMYKLNDTAGIKFIESVDRLIINRPYIDRHGNYHGSDAPSEPEGDPADADPQAMAEPIIYQPNIYKIIDETPTHYRIDAFVYNKTDWNALDPKVWNWVNMPWLFPKCSAENRKGQILNVMNGVDAFWVTLCHSTGAWIPKGELVLAPPASNYVVNGKRGIGYRVRGADWIMGLEDGSQVTVRKVTNSSGVQKLPGSHLNARSVV